MSVRLCIYLPSITTCPVRTGEVPLDGEATPPPPPPAATRDSARLHNYCREVLWSTGRGGTPHTQGRHQDSKRGVGIGWVSGWTTALESLRSKRVGFNLQGGSCAVVVTRKSSWWLLGYPGHAQRQHRAVVLTSEGEGKGRRREGGRGAGLRSRHRSLTSAPGTVGPVSEAVVLAVPSGGVQPPPLPYHTLSCCLPHGPSTSRSRPVQSDRRTPVIVRIRHACNVY